MLAGRLTHSATGLGRSPQQTQGMAIMDKVEWERLSEAILDKHLDRIIEAEKAKIKAGHYPENGYVHVVLRRPDDPFDKGFVVWDSRPAEEYPYTNQLEKDGNNGNEKSGS